MGEKTKSGQVAGAIVLLMSAVFLSFAMDRGWNFSGQLLVILGLFFGALGVGSIWKPETIGQIGFQILESTLENAEGKNRTYK